MDILSKYKKTIQSIFCKNLLELPEAEYIRHTQQMQGDKYRVFVIGFAGTAGMYSCSATAPFVADPPQQNSPTMQSHVMATLSEWLQMC